MNYSKSANLINIIFLIGLVGLPIWYFLSNTDIPFEFGRDCMMAAVALAVFVLMDWYHIYYSNSYKGIFYTALFNAIAVLITLSLVTILTKQSILESALLSNIDDWPNLLLRFYVGSVGLMCAVLFSLPRLFLIKIVSNSELPSYESA